MSNVESLVTITRKRALRVADIASLPQWQATLFIQTVRFIRRDRLRSRVLSVYGENQITCRQASRYGQRRGRSSTPPPPPPARTKERPQSNSKSHDGMSKSKGGGDSPLTRWCVFERVLFSCSAPILSRAILEQSLHSHEGSCGQCHLSVIVDMSHSSHVS